MTRRNNESIEEYKERNRKARMEYYYRNKDSEKNRMKEYSSSPNGKRSHFISVYKFRIKNPEKYKAHSIVRKSIRLGILNKLPCFICGNINSHAHHEDYNNPLDVMWLCPQHHKDIHVGKIEVGNVVYSK